jgi:lipopolysaccharide export system protein LptA
VVRAPSIQFQKNERMLIANASAGQKVSTVLVGTDKKGNATPVTVESNQLTYRDSERKAHFAGGVTLHSTDMTITAEQMDVLLAAAPPKSVEGRASPPVQSPPTAKSALSEAEGPVAPQSNGSQSPSSKNGSIGPAKLEKIIASGSVVITEPSRRATGQQLTYTASDDKFVLTGGLPCIFDAEHGKITGVSLTLYRQDGRVVVEGDSSSPAVTQTRVVR